MITIDWTPEEALSYTEQALQVLGDEYVWRWGTAGTDLVWEALRLAGHDLSGTNPDDCVYPVGLGHEDPNFQVADPDTHNYLFNLQQLEGEEIPAREAFEWAKDILVASIGRALIAPSGVNDSTDP